MQRMDAGGRRPALIVLVVPDGRLAEHGDGATPTDSLVIETSSLTNTTLRFPAHRRISAQNISVGLDSGIVSDHPFDRYTKTIGFHATTNDEPVPISLNFRNADAFFPTNATRRIPIAEPPLSTCESTISRDVHLRLVSDGCDVDIGFVGTRRGLNHRPATAPA
jgi:hypothetical protein